MHIFWARLAIFGHLGLISDLLIVSKFHNETHDPKRQENKIYTLVNGRETFYRRHTVPVTGCSEVKYILKRVSFGSKKCIKELKLECAYFLDQAGLFRPFSLISDPLIVSKFHNETCLDYIKLHGVHGNPSGTAARSDPCPLHLLADPRSALGC